MCFCARRVLWTWAASGGPQPIELLASAVCFLHSRGPMDLGGPRGCPRPVVLLSSDVVFAIAEPRGSGRQPGAPSQSCSCFRMRVFLRSPGFVDMGGPRGLPANRASGVGIVCLRSRSPLDFGGARWAPQSVALPVLHCNSQKKLPCLCRKGHEGNQEIMHISLPTLLQQGAKIWAFFLGYKLGQKATGPTGCQSWRGQNA